MDKEGKDMLLVSERPTNVSMGESIKKSVEKIEWLKDDLSILDYWNIGGWRQVEIIKNKDCNMDIQAIVNTGGSEGIYIDVAVRQHIYEDGSIQRIPLMTLKTLEESLKAYGAMGRIAGVITAVAETFLSVNWNVIE